MHINKERSVATSSLAEEDVQSNKFLATYASRRGGMTSTEKTLLHYTIILVV